MSRPYISDFWNLCEMIRDCEEKYTSDEVYFGIRFMQISAFSAGNGILSFENNINNFRVCYTKSSKGIPIKDGTINHRQTRQDWISRSQWTRGDQPSTLATIRPAYFSHFNDLVKAKMGSYRP